MTSSIKWNNFVNNFNSTKRTTGDFLKISKKHNISIYDLGELIDNDKNVSWEINGTGTLYQCKDCNSLEFVEIGKYQTHH